jgi:site-specific recombinase XerD
MPATRAAAIWICGTGRSPVRGKGKARMVKIGHEAAQALDRYLRVRSRQA